MRWRQNGRIRARTFDVKADALDFEAKLRTLKRSGDLDTVDSGKISLAEFVTDKWLPRYAHRRLEYNTRKVYGYLWNAHVKPRLGGYRLRELTPDLLEDFAAELINEEIGNSSVRKTHVMLQGILQRATGWSYLAGNPMRKVTKPREVQKRQVRPLTPATVERMRLYLLNGGKQRDAALISVLTYAGLRPSEALALTWAAIGMKTIRVGQALDNGASKETKTRQSRAVKICKPLAEDLAEWRLASGPYLSGDALVFPKMAGGFVSLSGYQNWRNRAWNKAAEAAGAADTTPYDARHTFVSLLINEGRTVVEVARQTGHSAATCLKHYAHLFDEQDLERLVPIDEAIEKARNSVREKFVAIRKAKQREDETPANE